MIFDKTKKIYMIGVKGVGMTMIAQYLKAQGHKITGSDVAETFMTDRVLKKTGIEVREGFKIDNIPNQFDLVIYSGAYNKDTNIELAEVLKLNKKVISYAEASAAIFNEKYGIAVIGSHGKTTTSAWLGFVLRECGRNPSVLVGANVKQFGGNCLVGKSEYLVAEVDEYQNKLKYFNPNVVLLNNIEYDHPDFFPTPDDYTQVFVDFIQKIPGNGFLVVNYDDKTIRKIAEVNTRSRVITYAITEQADFVAYDVKNNSLGNETRQYFKVKLASDEQEDVSETELGEFAISLPGKHNIYNALAVIATCVEMNIDLTCLRTALENFQGTDRRAELLGEFRGVPIIDDYAHHPTEIKSTLAGLHNQYPNKRLVVVFHPHTYTRTKAMLDDFADSFENADEVIVLDIYGSAREKQGGVSSEELVEKIKAKNIDAKYIPNLKECEEYLRQNTIKKDVVVLMGAGDVFRVGEGLLKL